MGKILVYPQFPGAGARRTGAPSKGYQTNGEIWLLHLVDTKR